MITTIAMPRRRDKVLHQFEDLRLDGDIECGGRLVRDQQLGVAGQADRNHHALAHAAGQLVRVLVEPVRGVGNADECEQFDCARLGLGGTHVQVNEQRLHQLQPDRQYRVQRRHRLLEDHRDVAAAHLAHLLVVEFQQIAALEHDTALDDPRRVRRQQPHDREGGHGLARAAFADDGDDFTGPYCVGDAFDSADRSRLRLEVDVKVVDFEDRTLAVGRSRVRTRRSDV